MSGLEGEVHYDMDGWSDGATPPAAKALTTSLVASAGDPLPAEDKARLLRLWITASGTVATTLSVALIPAKRPTETFTNMEAVTNLDSVSGGDAAYSTGLFTVLCPTGKTTPLDIPIVPGYAYQVQMKRTGGNVTTAALVTADYIY